VTVDHVGLAVADLEGMAEWYAAVLGATEDYRVDRPAIEMRAVVLIDAQGFRLELLHRDGSGSAHGAETVAESLLRHGFGHLALRVDDVPVAYARLLALGARPVMEPGAGSLPGMVIAFVADPEHNLLELISR
jgi:lactoylglutathione lyase